MPSARESLPLCVGVPPPAGTRRKGVVAGWKEHRFFFGTKRASEVVREAGGRLQRGAAAFGSDGDPLRLVPHGHFLLFNTFVPKTSNDIWVLPEPGGSGLAKPFPILATPFTEGQGRFSPDGRWIAYIAYISNESGAFEVYVRPFSPDAGAGASGAKWLISKGSGILPRWRVDDKQLLYVRNSFDVMAVDIDTSHGFQAGTPRRLFTAPPLAGGWDVAPDAKRFLFVASPNGGRTAPFTVVLNWQAGLKK